jgi:predicted Zn-dependent protease
MFVLLALICAAGLSGCTVNPVTGKKQLDLMGEAQEINLGTQLYPVYTQMSLGLVPDQQLQSYIQRVGMSVATVSHRPGLDYRFNAVNDPTVNAYALPGGKISITRGLLARFETEDELAAVLGHETGHVTARHSAQQYTAAMLTQLVLVGGQIYMESQDIEHREWYMLGAMFGAQLALARYSRVQEREADSLGMEYMMGAGYNPKGLIKVMEVLNAEHKRKPTLLERMFSTHPLTEERIATARAAVAGMPPQTTGKPLKLRPYQQQTTMVRHARSTYDQFGEARHLLAQGKVDRARSMLNKCVDQERNDGLLRAYLAATEMEKRNQQAAMRSADQAARDAQDIFVVQLIAGQVFVGARKYSQSLNYLNQAETILADSADVALLKGRAYEGMRRRNQAIEEYRRVIRLAPNSDAAQQAGKRLQKMGVQ